MKWIAYCENDKGGYFYDFVEAMTEGEARVKVTEEAQYIHWLCLAAEFENEDGRYIVTCPHCGRLMYGDTKRPNFYKLYCNNCGHDIICDGEYRWREYK